MRQIERVLAATFACVCLFGAAPALALGAFGLQTTELAATDADGAPATQAGSHPFALTTTIGLETVEESGNEVPDGSLRDLRISYPPGLVVHPAALPRCTVEGFTDIEGGESNCPLETVVGIARVTASASGPIPAGSEGFGDPVPIYNLVPVDGRVARIGFVAAGEPVVAELGLDDSPPYAGYAEVTDLTETILFYRARLVLWGEPADPAHDGERGPCAFLSGGSCPVQGPVRPLLTLPRACSGPLSARFEATSWEGSDADVATALAPGLTGCGTLSFLPAISVAPTTELADTPLGLEVSLDFFDEGLHTSGAIAQSDLRAIEVRLPEGVVLGDGALSTCSPTQLGQETLESESGDGCPTASRIGTIDAETPLLPTTSIPGEIFSGPFGEEIYLVLRHEQLGILVKQIGEVDVDSFTGQVTVVFADLPQLPASHVELRLEETEEGPLFILFCGDYTVESTMAPWSQPANAVLATSSFAAVAGANGGPCPEEEESPLEGGLGEPAAAASVPSAPAAALVVSPPVRKARACPRRKGSGVRRKARCAKARCARRAKRRKASRRCARRATGRRS